MPDDAPVTIATRPASCGSAIEDGVEAELHARQCDDRPAKRMAHQRLLRGGLYEGRDRLLGIVAVLLFGLDVDAVELERLLRNVVVRERLENHGGAVRAAGHLHLHAEPEGAQALLERRAAE